MLWKTTLVEALSEQGELAFLGTWVSEKLLGKEYGFYIHQIPFAEQLVKRVSADGAMRRRETPCEPESYTVGTPKTPKREFSDGDRNAPFAVSGWFSYLAFMPNSPGFGLWSQYGSFSDNERPRRVPS